MHITMVYRVILKLTGNNFGKNSGKNSEQSVYTEHFAISWYGSQCKNLSQKAPNNVYTIPCDFLKIDGSLNRISDYMLIAAILNIYICKVVNKAKNLIYDKISSLF